jgi:pimeloyl-ACP methyl ester carboxylesterase
MKRRQFLKASSAMAAIMATKASALRPYGAAKKRASIDADWYRKSRHFADLPMSRVAYVEHGRGPAALFVHGYPLNSYQWRGAIERLHRHRRCIAPDAMSLGHTETAQGQPLTPATQVSMLAALLDSLRVDIVDLVANDSGGLVAQLFVAKYPLRVRTLLLTNCDVDENNPPAGFVPLIELAKKGVFVDRVLAPQLGDKTLARSANGLGSVYSYPEKLDDETIEVYLRPLVATPLKKTQVDAYAVALGTNVLVPIREQLRAWKNPSRMVWGLKDNLFGVKWADWLDKTLPGSRGVRTVEDANLFFPEEMPDLIADECAKLWRI